jgi:hypothetical protein
MKLKWLSGLQTLTLFTLPTSGHATVDREVVRNIAIEAEPTGRQTKM